MRCLITPTLLQHHMNHIVLTMSGFVLLSLIFVTLTKCKLLIIAIDLQHNFLQMWFVEGLYSYGNTIA